MECSLGRHVRNQHVARFVRDRDIGGRGIADRPFVASRPQAQKNRYVRPCGTDRRITEFRIVGILDADLRRVTDMHRRAMGQRLAIRQHDRAGIASAGAKARIWRRTQRGRGKGAHSFFL